MAQAHPDRVDAVRRFNRFYTRRIGVLQEGLLESPYSLAEVRVLYELAHREDPAASELADELGLDRAYLSRILAGFQARGLVRRRPSEADGRSSLLSLTAAGRKAFATLDGRSSAEVRALLSPLPEAEQARLVAAMGTIERTLGSAPSGPAAYVLREPRPGDLGWVVARHGALYSEEYGWDERFEALVAGLVARFVERLDARRERCWIAERDGENVGCVFLVRRSARVAQLRMLLVEPQARGLGLGRRLVDECIRFAGQAGYRRIVLWTSSLLHAARAVYEGAGFLKVKEETEDAFGHRLVFETWERPVKSAGQEVSRGRA
jgi:DNA-binding MarR family transcriptional regulator/N-acetylglutamate synthase-like GNAT family acetyltransferase